MKRIIAVILSLSLILCSCGKSNEPLLKRELIGQNKYEGLPNQTGDAIPNETKAFVNEAKEKNIPIKLFDANNKELGDIEIAVKDEVEATMNIDSLKEAIPVDVCNITEALFFTYAGSRYTLTQDPVYIQHIQAMELTCDVPAGTSSLTLIPTPSPSASPIPEPQKKSEKENDKYAYLKIACVLVVIIVVPILIAYIMDRCSGGKTGAAVNAEGEGDQLGIASHRRGVSKKLCRTKKTEEEHSQDQVELRSVPVIDVEGEGDQSAVVPHRRKVSRRTRITKKTEEDLPRDRDQEEDQFEISEAYLAVLRQAVDSNNIGEVVRVISQLDDIRLAGKIPKKIRGRVYRCLKRRLHELAGSDYAWIYNEVFVFQTLVRAVGRIGLYSRLMREQRRFYIDNGVCSSYFAQSILDEGFKDETEIIPSIDTKTILNLDVAVRADNVSLVVDIISYLHCYELCGLLPVDLRGKVYEYLKGKLHALVEQVEWPQCEDLVFMTLVRAVNRIGLYDQLMDEEREFYISECVIPCYYERSNLVDGFNDVTRADADLDGLRLPPFS